MKQRKARPKVATPVEGIALMHFIGYKKRASPVAASWSSKKR